MNAVLPVFAMFFGSFLLFGIQPMLGRTLLPSFGGSAAVWTVCLAAYQVLLLVGYGYAHLLSRKPARTQRLTHFALLGLAVAWTFAFAALRLFLKGHIGDSATPSLEVLFCVTLFVGLPYVLLSANSTLIQAWLARDRGSKVLKCESAKVRVGENACGQECDSADLETQSPNSRTLELSHFRTSRSVYKLYAVSNLGSLLGLLVYPFVLEPYVSLNAQWYGFAVGFLAYVVLLAFVARRTYRSDRTDRTSDLRPPPSALSLPSNSRTLALSHFRTSPGLPPPLARAWLWLALPTVSTFLLNAVTMHLSTDVTPVPLMWVLLLTAYLLSFIIGFSALGEKGLVAWAGLAVLVLAGAGGLSGFTEGKAFLPNLSVGVLLLLVCCTFLHGWLYRIRPDASHLTRFYLGIAAGGALGGVSASLLAPVLFTRVWEYPLGLIAVCAACAWLIRTWRHPELKGLNTFLPAVSALAALLAFNSAIKVPEALVASKRNFYGCLRVTRSEYQTPLGDTLTLFRLRHGETQHGFQVHDPLLKKAPTAYYGPKAGGVAVTGHPKYGGAEPMRVGLIGLGAGTLAAYGRTNDVYRFYEINPQVVAFATDTNLFTFLADSAAKVELAVGDARKRLEQERARGEPAFDVLVVDAYSGDAIPFHLATREAFQLYLDRLAPGGILALHISNWHIDLMPLCKAVASTFNLQATGLLSPPEGLAFVAQWVYLSRAPLHVASEGSRETNWEQVREITLPTDEKGSLLPLIRLDLVPPMIELKPTISPLKMF